MQKKAEKEFYKHFNKQEYGSNLIDNFESYAQNFKKEQAEKLKHTAGADGVPNFYKGLYQKKGSHGQREDYGYPYPPMNASPYNQFGNSNQQPEDFSGDIPTTKEQTIFLTKRKLKRDLLGSSIEKIFEESNISSRNIFATVKQQKDHVEGLKKWQANTCFILTTAYVVAINIQYPDLKRKLKDFDYIIQHFKCRFSSIPVKDRIKVLTAKNYCLTYFLRYVFAKIQKEGPGEFAFQNKTTDTYFPLIPTPYYDPLMNRFGGQSQQPSGSSTDGEMKGENVMMSPKKIMINYTPISDKEFYFKKQRYLETSSQTAKEKKAEEKLINTVRLIDLDMYIDTFSIDPGLLSNLDTFYQLLTQCSKSQVFSKGPIHLRLDIQIGKWYWDNPQWFSATCFHTIAEWIVAIIERMLWKGYYQYLLSRGQFTMNSKAAKGSGLSMSKLSASNDLNSLHIHPNGYQLTKLQNQKVISLLMGDSIAAQSFWESTNGKTRHELLSNAFQTVENKIQKQNLEKDIHQSMCTENVHKLSFPFFYNITTLKKRLKKQFDIIKSKAINIAPAATLTTSQQSQSSASQQSFENSNQDEESKTSSVKEKSKKGGANICQPQPLSQKKSTFAKSKIQSKNDIIKKIEFYPQTFNPLWKVSDFAISTLRSCGNIAEFIGRQVYYHTFEKAKNAELDKLMQEEEKKNGQPSKKKNKKKKNKNKKVEQQGGNDQSKQVNEVKQAVIQGKVQEVKEDVKKGKKKNKNNKKKDAAKITLKQNTRADTIKEEDSKFDSVFDHDIHDFSEKLQKVILKKAINCICETDNEEEEEESEDKIIGWQIIDQQKSVQMESEKIYCDDHQEEKVDIIQEHEICQEELKGKNELQQKSKADDQEQQQQISKQSKQLQAQSQILSSLPLTTSQSNACKLQIENSQDQQEEQICNNRITQLQNIPITWTDDEEDQADDQLAADDQDDQQQQLKSKTTRQESHVSQKSLKSQKSGSSLTSSTDLKSSSQINLIRSQQIQEISQILPKKQQKKPRKRKHNNKRKNNYTQNNNNMLNKNLSKNFKSKVSKKQETSQKKVQTLPAGSIPSTLNSYGTIQGAGIPNIVAANQITFSEKVKKGLVKNQVKKQKFLNKNSQGKPSKYDSFPKNYYPDIVQNPCLDPFMMNMQFQQFFNAAASAIYGQQQQQHQQTHHQMGNLYPQQIQSPLYMPQRITEQQHQGQQFNPVMQNFLQHQPSFYPSQMNYGQNSVTSPPLTLNKSDYNSSSYSNFQQNLNFTNSDRASSQGCLPNLNYSSSSLNNMQSLKRKSVNSTNSCSTSGATTPPSQSSFKHLNNVSSFNTKPEYNLSNVNLQSQQNIQNSPIRPQRSNNLLDLKKILPGSHLKAEIPPFQCNNYSFQPKKTQIQEIKSQPPHENSSLWKNTKFPSLNQQSQLKSQLTQQNNIYSDQQQFPFVAEKLKSSLNQKPFDCRQDQQQQQEQQEQEQESDTDQHFKYQNAQDLSYDDPSYYSIYPNPQQIMQATATSYFQTVLSQSLLQQQHGQCNSAIYNTSPQSCMAHMKRFTIEKEQKLYISLSSQIQKLIQQIDSNVFELKPLRLASIRRIQKSIKSRIFGQRAKLLKIEVFGSHKNDLALQTSDIDIAICGLQNTHDWRSLVQTMDELAKTFRMQNYIQKVRVIDTATVPIIKLQVDLQTLSKEENIASGGKKRIFDFESICKRYTNGLSSAQADKESAEISKLKILKIDISFDQSFSGQNNMKQKSLQCTSHNGLQSSNYILRVLKHDYRLRMIVIILKKILYLNQLNQTYHGGFSSYVLVLLVQAYFRQFYISQTNYTPGKILMDFLDFIGNRFDNDSCTVQSNLNPPIIKASNIMMDTKTQQKSVIRIIDPLTGVNAAKGVYKIMDIRCLFSMIHCKLMHSGIEPAKRPLSVVLKTRLSDFDSSSSC